MTTTAPCPAPAARSLREWLEASPLQTQLAQARRAQQLEQALRACLPAETQTHLRVRHWREQQLVLVADSAAWATHLRFFLPTLRTACAALTANIGIINDIAIQVAPPSAPVADDTTAQSGNRSTPVLSAASADLLRQTGENCTDPDLRAALLRLSQRHHTR